MSTECLGTFLCPISGTFMKEPVINPSTQETCDLEALRTSRMNTHTIEDQDELLMPDLDLRSQISAWLHKYQRTPTFAHISTAIDLKIAVTSLLTQEPNDILEDSDMLDNLRELKLELQGNISLINMAQCSIFLANLIEGCPVSPDNVAEWVKLCVGIMAKDVNIPNQSSRFFMSFWGPVLKDIARVCVDIKDSDFQMGLVNLLYAFQKYKYENTQYLYRQTEHIIFSHGELIEALSSYILRPNDMGFIVSEDIFQKLFDAIIKLWVAEEGLKQPELSQSMARLVWPMPEKINNAQHRYLLRTISSVLDSRPRNPPDDDDDYDDHHDDLYDYIEGSLEVVTRAGLVRPVFQLLDYAMLADDGRDEDPLGWVARGRTVSEDEEDYMIMRCFEILCFLSSVTIGRLEMVRVIKRSGFRYLNAFCRGIARVISTDTLESHVIPALSVLCNLFENTRYTEMMVGEEGQGFYELKEIDFEIFDHEELTTMAANVFDNVYRIQKEEEFSEDEFSEDEIY